MERQPRIGGNAILEARGIVKRFGGLAAVDGLDLTIRRGEVLGVIGPNGAGKTTLVNCMTGLERVSRGTIVFNGTDVTRMRNYRIARLGMARTFQVVKPLHQLTVQENVAVGAMFGRSGKGRSAREARQVAESVLARVGLAGKRHRAATELTTPDLKRLELAKALAMEPELLFLDEVMAGLNPAEVENAMELIRSINRSGVTLLVIEHVMRAILGISDRLLVLHHGRKIADGSPHEVVESPAVVEAYLGEQFAARRKEGQAPAVTVPRAEKGALASRPSLLEVEGLASGYADVQILHGVSLEVREGEMVALIGANGAGKTTLLCTLSQLLQPRTGSIRFGGKDLTRASADEMVRAGIVHAPQGRRLFHGLTVRENLKQGAYLRTDTEEIAQDLSWVMDLFPRLRERWRQLAGHLSGGEQQMCAIARALMGRPRLLLIDELSLGLAPVVITMLLGVLREINSRGTAILFVEQDVQVALEHAHRGYVLETGLIFKTGPAAELLHDPVIRQAYLGL
jgi:ABC-type branched-subunit amino acid transport system ATPase component